MVTDEVVRFLKGQGEMIDRVIRDNDNPVTYCVWAEPLISAHLKMMQYLTDVKNVRELTTNEAEALDVLNENHNKMSMKYFPLSHEFYGYN